MTNAFVIDKGVPLPSGRHGESFAGTLRRLEVGDSVFIAGKTARHVCPMWKPLKPLVFTARTQDGGVRVWRVA